MDAQRIVQELSTALSNDDLWSHPEIVDDVEKLADAYDELKAENERLAGQCGRLFDKTLELAEENARLKESLAEAEHDESMAWDRTCKADAENERLRDLIFDMLVDEERGNTEENTFYEHVRLARELGIELDA